MEAMARSISAIGFPDFLRFAFIFPNKIADDLQKSRIWTFSRFLFKALKFSSTLTELKMPKMNEKVAGLFEESKKQF